MKQEHQVDLSKIAVSCSNMHMVKDWNYKKLNTDTLNLDENKHVDKKNYHEGNGSPRYSNTKHARNGRDEESVRTTNR